VGQGFPRYATTLNHLGDSWKSARDALNFAAFLFYTGFPGSPSGSFFQYLPINSPAVHRSGVNVLRMHEASLAVVLVNSYFGSSGRSGRHLAGIEFEVGALSKLVTQEKTCEAQAQTAWKRWIGAGENSAPPLLTCRMPKAGADNARHSVQETPRHV
jgi:hypothetical protein